jgi:hypothetical protein
MSTPEPANLGCVLALSEGVDWAESRPKMQVVGAR